jgi:hypothetical protein
MKIEEPILFKRKMIEAFWRGDKTQTRRIEKKQPAHWATFDHFDPIGQAVFSDGTIWPARYGQPTGFVEGWAGTVLWVKESFRHGTCPNDSAQGIALFNYDPTRREHDSHR